MIIQDNGQDNVTLDAGLLEDFSGDDDIPEEFTVPIYAPGPLIDVMTVEEGASYLTKKDASGTWDEALDAVTQLPGDKNVARFCAGTVSNSADLADLMEACPREDKARPFQEDESIAAASASQKDLEEENDYYYDYDDGEDGNNDAGAESGHPTGLTVNVTNPERHAKYVGCFF